MSEAGKVKTFHIFSLKIKDFPNYMNVTECRCLIHRIYINLLQFGNNIHIPVPENQCHIIKRSCILVEQLVALCHFQSILQNNKDVLH